MAGWIDRWREVTVALGRIGLVEIRQASGELVRKKLLLVVGTGVLFAVDHDPTHAPWLVTAKHIFADPSEQWHPSSIRILFSWLQGKERKDLGIPIRLTQHGKPLWAAHPNRRVDLACLPLRIKQGRSGRKRLPRVSLDDLLTEKAIYEGAPVGVFGYPGAVGPHYGQRAIVRQGIVSWVSPTQPRSQTFLIDSHVFPGHSGGPVLKLPAGIDRDGHIATHGKVGLLGIVTQARVQNLPLIAGGIEVEIHFKGKKGADTLLAPSFVSLGLVEPAYRIRQLLTAARGSHRKA